VSDRLEAARVQSAAPGTAMGLQVALRERMKLVAARLPMLETKGQELRAANVLDGWLPPKDADDRDRYPFLIVRPAQGADSAQGADEGAVATFEIIVGTYSDTDDGWFDVMVMIDAIRLELAEAPVLERTSYQHVGPLAWAIPEEQPRPQWHGVVTTNWTLPRPRRVEARNPEGSA